MGNFVELKKEQCTGCGACSEICPRTAIRMEADDEGFLYPVVEMTKCINCGLCQKVCPYYTRQLPEEDFSQLYYAAQHKDDGILADSSSGGVFTALAEEILDEGGVVYGAAFDDDFTVCHIRAESKETIKKLRGSKYIQSTMEDILQMVLADLEKGPVLFSGAPCQIDGVRNYVGQKRGNAERLFLCDFVCHGVSSPRLWKDYVEFLETREGKLTLYNFRNKDHGWHNCFPKIESNGRNVSFKYKNRESYQKLYSRSVITRPSCYLCRYTEYKRASDITLGDFWNIQKIAGKMDDNRGMSQVLINSAKGEYLWRKCANVLTCKQCKKEDVWQPHLEYPMKRPRARDRFWKAYHEKNFQDIIKFYGNAPAITRCRKAIMPVIERLGLYVLAGKIYKLMLGKGSGHA